MQDSDAVEVVPEPTMRRHASDGLRVSSVSARQVPPVEQNNREDPESAVETYVPPVVEEEQSPQTTSVKAGDSDEVAIEKRMDTYENVPLREWKFHTLMSDRKVAFNPLVSMIGVAVLWGLSIWCMSK